MTYPQPPWTLQGHALCTLHWLDIERVRSLIPSEFDLISLLPGKTLGGVYLSSYSSGSVLEYSELIVVAGLVSYSGRWGAWISHIYVDNPNSVAGGREIWGLPKELAKFTWEQNVNETSSQDGCVSVYQNNELLCRLSYSRNSFRLPVPLSGNVFSILDSSILFVHGKVESHIGLMGSKLLVPAESPFGSLELGQPWLSVYCDQLRLGIGVPEVVAHKETVLSYQ